MKKEMITDISKYLEGQGVGYLTGEACGIGLRKLYDLTERGKILVEQFLSTTADSAPWNSTVGIEPTVASIMLPPAILRPQAIFAMFVNGATAVIDVDVNDIMRTDYLWMVWNTEGYNDPDYQELLDKVRDVFGGKFIVWTDSSTSHSGRNEHVFSGRIV